MLIIFSEHKMITFFLLLFFLISILCQIISGVIYQNMIKQSENMSETENKLLKLCKQKYAGYYKLNGRMINTSVYVDKFIKKLKDKKLKELYRNAVDKIREDYTLGDPKTGDLAGYYGYDIYYNKTNYELAYTIEQIAGEFGRVMAWADKYRTLKVRTNADTPADAGPML